MGMNLRIAGTAAAAVSVIGAVLATTSVTATEDRPTLQLVPSH